MYGEIRMWENLVLVNIVNSILFLITKKKKKKKKKILKKKKNYKK